MELVHGAKSDDIFAPTPSLEAFKMLLSKLASISRHGLGSHRLMLMDVSEALTRNASPIALPPSRPKPLPYKLICRR